MTPLNTGTTPITHPMSSFFDYTCDLCDAPVCERVSIMNLALDYENELFCLDCLAREQGQSRTELIEALYSYIQSRECFQTPWNGFDPTPCPRQKDNTCCSQGLPTA